MAVLGLNGFGQTDSSFTETAVTLFWTPDVPAAWHTGAVHRAAVAVAPDHYEHIRLHKGLIPGAFLGDGGIRIEQTLYLQFCEGVTWRAVRSYGARPLTLS